MAAYAIPAPMRGPTATPLKMDTERIVPKTSAVVICGSSCNRDTPPFASNATAIPEIRATQASGDLKALVKSLKPISPDAIGANTAMVITVTPQLIPLLCIKVKDFVSSPLNFKINKTTMAINNELFFAIIPMIKSSNRNNNG